MNDTRTYVVMEEVKQTKLSRTKIKNVKRITKRFTPKQYLAELLLGLTALLGLYLIVAWSSYTP